MAYSTADTVKKLNHLIETAADGEEGYKQAADNVDHAQLKSLFTQLSSERAQMKRDLMAEVRRLGGEPETDGSWAGSFHRGWVNLKGTFSTATAEATLEECVRGDESAVKEYEEYLENARDYDTQSIAANQLAAIRQDLQKIRTLEKMADAAN